MTCKRCHKAHLSCENCGLPNPTCRRYRCQTCWRLLCNFCAEGEDVLPRERVIYCAREVDEDCHEHGIGFVAALLFFSIRETGG